MSPRAHWGRSAFLSIASCSIAETRQSSPRHRVSLPLRGEGQGGGSTRRSSMRRSLVTVGLVVGFALLAPPARAQSGGARGKVMDEAGKPLVDAPVATEPQANG